jgi:polyphenol oxidase
MKPKHPHDLTWQFNHPLHIAYSQASDAITHPQNLQIWTQSIEAPSHVVFPTQVHGSNILTLTEDHLKNHPLAKTPADGLVTNLNVGLGVWGSDCPGLVISCGDGIFGVAHCGWRGIVQQIPLALVQALKKLSSAPCNNWEALIGPGICNNCYEVDAPVLSAWSWPNHCLKAIPNKPDHALLDLKLAIRCQLEAMGISKVTDASICTAEDHRLHSFRHQGHGPNQGLLAWPRSS